MFALDYDGTIADTNSIKVEWIRKNLRRDVPKYNCDRTSCVPLIGLEEYDRMSKEVYARDPTLAAKPVPGAPQALETLAAHGSVYILTARRSTLSFAQEWLEKNSLASHIREIISVTDRPKIIVAGNLGCKVLIDDDKRHLLAVPNAHLLLIHLRIGFDQMIETEENIRMCTTWHDAVWQAIHRKYRHRRRHLRTE